MKKVYVKCLVCQSASVPWREAKTQRKCPACGLPWSTSHSIDKSQINPFIMHEFSPVRSGVLGCPEAREREQFWRPFEGPRIRPRDMSLAHLINALRMLARGSNKHRMNELDPAWDPTVDDYDRMAAETSRGRLLLAEWHDRASAFTPHWTCGEVPPDREWWEKHRLQHL